MGVHRFVVVCLVVCLPVAAGCRGSGAPSPSTSTGPGPSTAGATTTVRLPTLTAAPIAGLDAGTFHDLLEKAGFTKAAPAGPPGFITTTSKRPDATVSTYGTGASDVVKVVAEADRAAAASVLSTVIASVVTGPDAKKADAWVKSVLKKGPLSPSLPRTASATYAKVPYDLLVNASTATLSIGRITS